LERCGSSKPLPYLAAALPGLPTAGWPIKMNDERQLAPPFA
jgi:hypothetical protein